MTTASDKPCSLPDLPGRGAVAPAATPAHPGLPQRGAHELRQVQPSCLALLLRRASGAHGFCLRLWPDLSHVLSLGAPMSVRVSRPRQAGPARRELASHVLLAVRDACAPYSQHRRVWPSDSFCCCSVFLSDCSFLTWRFWKISQRKRVDRAKLAGFLVSRGWSPCRRPTWACTDHSTAWVLPALCYMAD